MNDFEVFNYKVCLVKLYFKHIRIFAQDVLYLALLAPGLPAVYAGFITPETGVGGTFDSSVDNSFTLTDSATAKLFPDVYCESARAFFGRGVTIPADAFVIESFATANSVETTDFGNVDLITDAGAESCGINPFVNLESQITREILSDVTSAFKIPTFKIPTFSVIESWYLKAAVPASEDCLTDDAKTVQRLTTTSFYLIPEPSSLVLVGLGFGIAAFRGRRKFLKSTIGKSVVAS